MSPDITGEAGELLEVDYSVENIGGMVDKQDIRFLTSSPRAAIPDSVVLLPQEDDLDHFEGDTDQAEIQSGVTFEQDLALGLDGSDNGAYRIWSNSGLNNYPERGDTFRVWVRTNDNSSQRHRIVFGSQSGGWRSNGGYALELNTAGGYISVIYFDSNGDYNDDSRSDFNFDNNTWYESELIWGDTDITHRLLDQEGNELETVTLSDTTWNTGGVGLGNATSGTETTYIENYRMFE